MSSRALALSVFLLVPQGAHASRVEKEKHATPSKKWPAIELSHLSTHEHFTLRPDASGHFGNKQLKGIRHFLRCHHTGREHPMNAHLLELLYKTAHHFGDREVSVVAGYRAPKVARKKGNPRSPHKRGVACDFRIAGVDNETLRDYLRSAFSGVGVGFYPNSGFVHLDVGRRQNAFWIDYSGPGERAQYARDPDGDLESGAVLARTRSRAPEPDGDAPDGDDADCGPFDDDPGLVGQVVPPPPSPTPPGDEGDDPSVTALPPRAP